MKTQSVWLLQLVKYLMLLTLLLLLTSCAKQQPVQVTLSQPLQLPVALRSPESAPMPPAVLTYQSAPKYALAALQALERANLKLLSVVAEVDAYNKKFHSKVNSNSAANNGP